MRWVWQLFFFRPLLPLPVPLDCWQAVAGPPEAEQIWCQLVSETLESPVGARGAAEGCASNSERLEVVRNVLVFAPIVARVVALQRKSACIGAGILYNLAPRRRRCVGYGLSRFVMVSACTQGRARNVKQDRFAAEVWRGGLKCEVGVSRCAVRGWHTAGAVRVA